MSKKTKMVWQKHRGFTAHRPAKTFKLNQERCKSELRELVGRSPWEAVKAWQSLAANCSLQRINDGFYKGSDESNVSRGQAKHPHLGEN